MTEQEYKDLLTKPEIPLELWYEFFLDSGGTRIEFSLFANIFLLIIQQGETPIIGKSGILKYVSLESASGKFHEHYRKQFNL